ncbi:MAG TPA: hypothetical protein VFE09_00690 [Rubrobacteraceae bacterium]|nr:hypothetical protein [Rubrobacteraceae bacterium]
MRRVIVSEFVSLDGVMEASEKWHFPYWSDEMGEYKSDELAAADALLLHGAFGTIESCFARLLPELARYGRQDPHGNGPERVLERRAPRRAPRRASGRLAERIRAP